MGHAWLIHYLTEGDGIAVSLAACSRSFTVALPAVVLMGIGFSTPYAVMMDEAQRLFPTLPLAPIAVPRRRREPEARSAAYAMKNATSDIISA